MEQRPCEEALPRSPGGMAERPPRHERRMDWRLVDQGRRKDERLQDQGAEKVTDSQMNTTQLNVLNSVSPLMP